MAGDQEKTEDPTAQRRSQAREDGQVPRSQELTTAMLLVGAAMVLNTVGVGMGRTVFEMFGFGLANLSAAGDPGSLLRLMQETGWKLFGTVALFFGAMGGISLAVTGLQSRATFSPKALAPKWDKLDPMKNSAQLFKGSRSLVELLKAVLKLLIVAWAVRGAMTTAWPEILALLQQSPFAVVDVIRRYSVRLLTAAGGAYLVLGLLDYGWQIWQHEKGLKMSKEEVRQEMKQSEVSPMVKQRMRSAARDRARRQMFGEVPTADVVITNPTHIAVALKYEQGKDVAPVVVAMGQEKIAQKIKEIAREAGVPMVENRPVARALFASARVGSAIPQELYMAIIEIYAFVIRQRQATRPAGRN